jgi:hypothetical protein
MDKKYMLYLSGVISENDLYEGKEDTKNYMFFKNLKTIEDLVKKLLSMNEKELDKEISDGHDWVADHISTSKDHIQAVYNWAKNN